MGIETSEFDLDHGWLKWKNIHENQLDKSSDDKFTTRTQLSEFMDVGGWQCERYE